MPEDHSVIGGLGDRILESLSESNKLDGKKFEKIGLRNEYPECGTPWEVLQYHGFDGKSLALKISEVADLDERIEADAKKKYIDDAPQ